VKWWFLAIPHYLIVGVLTSGLVWWTQDASGDGAWEASGGLMTLLVLISLVALLFAGTTRAGCSTCLWASTAG